ncbi:MAG: lipoate--protein ligase, partial [Clostridiales bacterium]|nr:lipoate--protein ligase [Clostridiales bacterium]
MINKLQIYTGEGFDPYKNLAVEKYLFDSVGGDCMILYLWQNEKTVVIGKNQNPWAECGCALLEEEGGKLARRLSGGGAVFHDKGNLNFTFLCAAENFDIPRQMSVIKRACDFAGIETELSGRNDILAQGRKFSGNAFYHSQNRAYHHGTILINADFELMQRYLTPPKAKLEAKGVKSVRSRVINLSELSESLTCESMKQYMVAAFEDVYGLKAEQTVISDAEKIKKLADEYGSWDFLYGKTVPFTVSCEEKFDWGCVQLLLQIENGAVQSARLYTDAMDADVSEIAENALLNRRLEENEVQNALKSALPAPFADD